MSNLILLNCYFVKLDKFNEKQKIFKKTKLKGSLYYQLIELVEMQKVKKFVLEWDFFSHSTLHRYKEDQSYRTFVGGMISIILVIIFCSVFFNLTFRTLKKEIILSSSLTIFQDNPSKIAVITDPSKKFMFAVGMNGIDFTDNQRYFDVYIKNRKYLNDGPNYIKNQTLIYLKPCSEDHWKGITDSITNNYQTQQFNQWLCPDIGQQFFLQGKYTSDTFQFSQLVVQKCTEDSIKFPGTSCKNQTEIQSLISTLGELTLSFYFANTLINSEQIKYLDYYLQDRNYFTFNRESGVSANLFFQEFQITTDHSFFPWSEHFIEKGFSANTATDYRRYPVTKEYLKLFLRKSPEKVSVSREVQKLDQTFSYIGGLFGTIVLLLIFLNLYSKYCYELEFGDKLFRETERSSFGSENFNFIVFLGYCFFNICDIIGINLNWEKMKRYHLCRSEVQKQLNIDLLYKKLAHFQEVAEIILQEHQLKMLLMAPKPTLEKVRRDRKRFLAKSIIYHQLQKKAHYVHVQPQVLQNRLHTFLNEYQQFNPPLQQCASPRDKNRKEITSDLVSSYKKIKKQSVHLTPFTEKILEKLKLKQTKKIDFEKVSNIFEKRRLRSKKTLQSQIQQHTYYYQKKKDIFDEKGSASCIKKPYDLNDILKLDEKQ